MTKEGYVTIEEFEKFKKEVFNNISLLKKEKVWKPQQEKKYLSLNIDLGLIELGEYTFEDDEYDKQMYENKNCFKIEDKEKLSDLVESIQKLISDKFDELYGV